MTLNRSQASYCSNQAKMLLSEAVALEKAAEPLRLKYLKLHTQAEQKRQAAADLQRTAHVLQQLALAPKPHGCPNSDKPQRKQCKRVVTKQEAIAEALAFIKAEKKGP